MTVVHFTSHSLSAAEEIVREIEQWKDLKALRLEGNTIGVEAAQAIAKALESKKELQVLLITFLFYSIS